MSRRLVEVFSHRVWCFQSRLVEFCPIVSRRSLAFTAGKLLIVGDLGTNQKVRTVFEANKFKTILLRWHWFALVKRRVYLFPTFQRGVIFQRFLFVDYNLTRLRPLFNNRRRIIAR